MITNLDLPDIQGNIVKAYGRYGYPIARYVFYEISDPTKGRLFVQKVAPLVTTSVPWAEDSPKTPPVAINIAFTYQGLKNLDIPDDTLHGFPDEFAMGMKGRRDIIGDTGPNHYKHWDPIWNDPADELRQNVHILIGINAKNAESLEDAYEQICNILAAIGGGVAQLVGHRGPNRGENLAYQTAIASDSDREHFGYADGISTSYFEGCRENKRYMIGGGKPTGLDPTTEAGWAPLAAGEFVFGHADESGAYPEAPGPPLFSRNGTFMVYRKLHQNVAAFRAFIETEGAKFGCKETFAAKLSGRWPNGAPLATFPTKEGADTFVAELGALLARSRQESLSDAETARLAKLRLQLTAYDYNDDTTGAKCPFSAHTRRTNPRSALQFGEHDPFNGNPGALSNRRRILRRGLPYGDSPKNTTDADDHGVIMMIVNADLSRQFEFVQEQWINYGNDFRLSNDQDALLGNNGHNENGRGKGRMVIEGDADTNKPPYFCSGIPTMVETRGGDYFFVPSMTCLRMIAMGIVDPT